MSAYKIKRKIQIRLRRFMFLGETMEKYDPIFDLTNIQLREWMESQFSNDMNWSNYAKVWDIDHRIPVCYFNLNMESEINIAYNFVNIRPGLIQANRNKAARLDIIHFEDFFDFIFQNTGLNSANLLIKKIAEVAIENDFDIKPKCLFVIKKVNEYKKDRTKIDAIISEIKKA